jgi:fumarylacetoacetase
MRDGTHDPALVSWVESANVAGCDFPIQNLPYARFRRRGSEEPWRVGVAIGDQVLDLAMAAHLAPWGDGLDVWLEQLAAGDLAAFMKEGPRAWRMMRSALSLALVADGVQGPFLELCLVEQRFCEYDLPCVVGDYTDFFAGIHHARAAGALLRPDHPLLPNYRHVPIGYHGRASSVILEGGAIRRPRGQVKTAEGEPPQYLPTRRLDYELEIGLWIGQPNALGDTLSMDEADQRLFGITLLNDWSARDVQAWEYQPLGPFLAKSFATSVSPWVVTVDALAPFRRPFVRPEGDPQPLPYLDSPFNREAGAFDIHLEVWLETARMRAARAPAVRLSHSNALDAYWTPAQLVAHHASNGCNLRVGDLLGTGTLSGRLPGQGGCLLELTRGGRAPITLPGSETRAFLEDGDRVTLRAYCEAPDARRIGLGAVSGTVAPADRAAAARK